MKKQCEMVAGPRNHRRASPKTYFSRSADSGITPITSGTNAHNWGQMKLKLSPFSPMRRDNRVRDTGGAGPTNQATDGRSRCGQLHLKRPPSANVGGTYPGGVSGILGGRSEEVSQICVMWGKAVAVSRYQTSAILLTFLRSSVIPGAQW